MNIAEAKVVVDEGSLSDESEDTRPANAPLVRVHGRKHHLSPEASARRCYSKGRGSVYDPVFGICCHFCRFFKKISPRSLHAIFPR